MHRQVTATVRSKTTMFLQHSFQKLWFWKYCGLGSRILNKRGDKMTLQGITDISDITIHCLNGWPVMIRRNEYSQEKTHIKMTEVCFTVLYINICSPIVQKFNERETVSLFLKLTAQLSHTYLSIEKISLNLQKVRDHD